MIHLIQSLQNVDLETSWKLISKLLKLFNANSKQYVIYQVQYPQWYLIYYQIVYLREARAFGCNLEIKGSSWSWWYGSCIYKYLCNQCLSPLMLWVRTPFMAMCTWCNIMWMASCYKLLISRFTELSGKLLYKHYLHVSILRWITPPVVFPTAFTTWQL